MANDGDARSALALHAPEPDQIRACVAAALAEDIGRGDLSADLLPADTGVEARVISRQTAVIAGRPWFDACFHQVEAGVAIDWQVAEGDTVQADQVLCRLRGSARALVSAERCALNFLQTLSATATSTAACVAQIHGSTAQILDTRKTLPGLRLAQKYAVRAGGGRNHRMGLYDAIMLKENHIAAAGSIAAAVTQAADRHPDTLLICEVENLDELHQALDAGVAHVLLDEFSLDELRDAVRINGGRAKLEASGGIERDGLRAIADTGVDYISVGAITKHVRAVDLSMRVAAVAA
ncbi:MAG: carboxylating nicotinate-nucleotide diphosphorylase [Xanthomonadales bacterium]|nr:carboxylating nicotinate-nucleotide diphosphorylase [Xanthomonadales bacterium]MCB1745121.1 carboxylating nicotinate-nucleotide diphosphorylase [Gammaproteobacteria bacterium]